MEEAAAGPPVGGSPTNLGATSHRSREMVVSLGSQRTFVMGTKAKPVTVAQYRRRLLCTHVSTILTD
jgi:hypothetical protein